jgi:AAA15 family ATPase/GTPase
MLRRVSVTNYKMFQQFSLDFTRGVTLICGPNGSGKSALREVLFTLCSFLALPGVTERVARSVSSCFPYEVISRWMVRNMEKSKIEIGLHIGDYNENRKEDDIYRYALIVDYSHKEHRSTVFFESLTLCEKETEQQLVRLYAGELTILNDKNETIHLNTDRDNSALVTASSNNSRIRRFGQLVSNIMSVHLCPSLLSADFTIGSQTIGEFGESFSAWNFSNTNRQIQRQPWVFEQCKNFIPGFIAANSHPVGDSYRCKVSIEYNGKPYELALSELSDGQKILFALYSILANVADGSTILIDEPENFLAPSELQPWLDAIHDACE